MLVSRISDTAPMPVICGINRLCLAVIVSLRRIVGRIRTILVLVLKAVPIWGRPIVVAIRVRVVRIAGDYPRLGRSLCNWLSSCRDLLILILSYLAMRGVSKVELITVPVTECTMLCIGTTRLEFAGVSRCRVVVCLILVWATIVFGFAGLIVVRLTLSLPVSPCIGGPACGCGRLAARCLLAD